MPSPKPPRSSLRARSRWAPLGLLGLALLAGLALLLWPKDAPGPREHSAEPGPASAVQGDRAPTPAVASADPGSDLPRATRSGESVGAPGPNRPPAPPARPVSDVQVGPGKIRGELDLPKDLELSTWTLRIEPSVSLFGPELGRSVRQEQSAGQLEFEITDLPLAGYDVWAEAQGLNSRHLPVLLTPGRQAVHVILTLSKAGSLQGSVIDTDGVGIQGLTVTLTPRSAEERSQSISDAGGRYAFQQVLDGEYQLTVGPTESPLLPPKALSFQAPSMTVEALVLPRLLELEIEVLDDLGRPVAGARVQGFSKGGGIIDATTDSLGRARGHLLSPGRVDLRTQVEGLGRGFASILLDPAQEANPRVTLQLIR